MNVRPSISHPYIYPQGVNGAGCKCSVRYDDECSLLILLGCAGAVLNQFGYRRVYSPQTNLSIIGKDEKFDAFINKYMVFEFSFFCKGVKYSVVGYSIWDKTSLLSHICMHITELDINLNALDFYLYESKEMQINIFPTCSP